MLWKMGFVELLLPNAININARSIECCELAASPAGSVVGCISLRCGLGTLALLDSGHSSCLLCLTHSGILEFFLSSSLVF